MRYRTLGDSGLLVSVVGLGCNNFGGRLDVEQTRAVVDAAIDEGITLLDTAETYGGNGASELALGEVLPVRVGTRKMALDDPIWPIVPKHSRQMSCIETHRARRYERGKRSGAHQRMHLRQIGDAKMIGQVHGNPFRAYSHNSP